jgi:hypothetical protein
MHGVRGHISCQIKRKGRLILSQNEWPNPLALFLQKLVESGWQGHFYCEC